MSRPALCAWRWGAVVALAVGGAALTLHVRAQTEARAAAVATLAGASVEISGGAATLDATGRLQVPDGASIRLAGTTARLDLLRGGTIRLCGPASMSVASGGGDAYLVSLSQGGLDLRYASAVADSWLTPDYRITTVVPPDQLATVSASVGLQADGTVCLMNRGSALSVERLWDGTQQYVINGQTLQFHPGGATETAASCPCAAPAPEPVPPAPDSPSGAAGPLFPQQPALTVSSNGATSATGAPVASAATAAPAAPASKPRHNVVVRFFRWLAGKH